MSREDFNRNIPKAFEQKDNGDDLSAILPINKTNNDFTKLSTTMQIGGTFTKEISNISRITAPRSPKMKMNTGDVISKDQIQARQDAISQ